MRTLCFLLLCGSSLLAQTPVVVAVVRPWSATSSFVLPTWNDIQTNWFNYGTRPVLFDTTSFVSAPITAASLNSVNPDVLYFSDSMVNQVLFSAADRVAIEQFLLQPSKRAVGTFLVFNQGINSAPWLRPIFGIEATQVFQTSFTWDRNVANLEPTSPLTAGMGATYLTTAWQDVSVPLDGTYDAGDTLGTVVAMAADRKAIVHYYDGSGADAVYFSYMPEYTGSLTDLQLLYNAFTAPRIPRAILALQGAPTIGTAVGISFESTEQPNAPYALALALGTSPGITLAPGIILPLNPDALFWLSLSSAQSGFVNMSGILDGSGIATAWAVLLIPNQPSLIGATIYAAGLTLDSSATAGIGSLSLPLPITFQ